jgi:hypothetical protein
MEFDVFLLGAGMALFIALLGWSDQFRLPQKETRRIEKIFMEKLRLKTSELIPIMRGAVKEMKSGEQDSFLAEIKAMAKILVEKKVKNKYDINLVNDFKNIEKQASELYKFYNYKYLSTIFLTVVFFISGISSSFFGTVTIYELTVNIISFLIPMVLITVIITLLLKINGMETKFRNGVKILAENIGVR